MSLSTTWLSDIFEKVSETCLLHEQTGVFITADLEHQPSMTGRMFCVVPVQGLNNERGLMFLEDVKKNFKFEELLQCAVLSPRKDLPDQTQGINGEIFEDSTINNDEIHELCVLLFNRYFAEETNLGFQEMLAIPNQDKDSKNPTHKLVELPLPEATHNPRTLH